MKTDYRKVGLKSATRWCEFICKPSLFWNFARGGEHSRRGRVPSTCVINATLSWDASFSEERENSDSDEKISSLSFNLFPSSFFCPRPSRGGRIIVHRSSFTPGKTFNPFLEFWKLCIGWKNFPKVRRMFLRK